MATVTLNPTLDGRLRQTNGAGGSETWASIIAAAGNGEQDGADGGNFVIGFTTQTTDPAGWRLNTRYTYIFDLSTIPAGSTITSAIFSIYGLAKADALSATPDINVYGATPASTSALVGTDYANVGSTAFCDTAITYAGFSTTGYNDFTFNATGIAALIAKIGTKVAICVRNANYDVAASIPPHGATNTSSSMTAYTYAETTTPNAKPKLVINYSTGNTSSFLMFMPT